jgi:hypothetical protein
MANRQDGDINVRINTSSDPKGIDQTRRGVRGLLDEIKTAPGLLGKVNAAFSGLLINPAIAAFAALAAAIGTTRKAVGEFSDSQRELRSWATAAAAQGKLTEGFRNQVEALVDSMEELTAIDGAEWWKAIEEVTKRGAGPENIERYIRGIANLTALMGSDGSVEAAAKIFGQAMSGQTMALKRLGIEIDETKSLAEQLESILAQAAERGAGVLEGRGKTLSGEMDRLKLQFNKLSEAVGGFLYATGLLQVSMGTMTMGFRFLRSLLPEVKVDISDIANRTPEAANALKEAGEAAAAGAKGIQDQKSALDQLTGAYDQARKAADEFRAHQDALDDEEAANQLARIDYLVEAGVLNADDASKARAGVRRETVKRKTDRELAAMADEESRLRADSAQAANRQIDTEERAKGLSARRDSLLTEAAAFFGVDAGKLRDPKQLEELLRLEKLRLSDPQPRSEREAQMIANRMSRFNAISELPNVLAQAAAAEAEAAAARSNYDQVFAATSPRMEANERRRHVLGFVQSRIETENKTELLRAAKNPQGGAPTDFRNPAFAPAFGNFGGEMQENTRLQENNGSKILQIIREQNMRLNEFGSQLEQIRSEQGFLKSRERHNRNR